MNESAHEVLKKIEFLLEKYSDELRATTQPYHLRRVSGKVKDYKYHPEDILIRETLMEHVGSLPVVATAIYPYINDNEVDLGRALTMLAVHDIGELIEGDQMTFTKTDNKAAEREAAMKLLDPYYHEIFEDVESQTSKSAKFAKSIDKITADIVDYLTPADITIERYRHFTQTGPDKIIDLITKHKRPYMLWNPFLTELHTILLDEFSKKLKKNS